MKKIDITGHRFGKLVAMRPNGFDQSPSRKHIKWECQCDCGALIDVRLNCLRSGNQKSCGCLKHEAAHKRTHNMSGSIEHQTWARIKARCFNKNHKDYHLYGGRGITICSEWKDSFEKFYEDMGARPANMTSIDRIDPNGDYSKENCRWADDYTQSRNKRNSVYLEFDGKRMCQSDWAEFLGINVSTLMERLSKWSLERSLSTFKEK